MNDTYNEIQSELNNIIPMLNKMHSYHKKEIKDVVDKIIILINLPKDIQYRYDLTNICYDSIYLHTKVIDDIVSKIDRSPAKQHLRVVCQNIRRIIENMG